MLNLVLVRMLPRGWWVLGLRAVWEAGTGGVFHLSQLLLTHSALDSIALLEVSLPLLSNKCSGGVERVPLLKLAGRQLFLSSAVLGPTNCRILQVFPSQWGTIQWVPLTTNLRVMPL